MRKLCLCMVALLLLCLAACGQTAAPAGSEVTVLPPAQALGRYLCTSVKMNGRELGQAGEWVELKDQGKMSLYLSDTAEDARWTLTGTAFTMSVGDVETGTGTLVDGTLTLNAAGMEYTFVQEGAQSQEETRVTGDTEEPATPVTPSSTLQPDSGTPDGATAIFSCQGGLYYLDYPSDIYYTDTKDLADLVTWEGGKVWITRLDSKEHLADWRTGFEQKAQDPSYLNYAADTFQVGEYEAQYVLYQNQDVWHSEVIVDFGRNKGTDETPMYAAYLHFSGPSQEAVWGQAQQAMVSSLRLDL